MAQHGGRSVTIGGNVSVSAVVAGDENQVQVTAGASLPADQAAVVQELAALREVLASLGGKDGPRITNAIDEAVEEAKAPEPRKDVIAESLERALKLAAGVTGVAAELAKLKPGLTTVVAWLGSGFRGLLALIGV